MLSMVVLEWVSPVTVNRAGVLDGTTDVPIVAKAPERVEFPVMASVPPTVALFVMAALLSVAAPEEERTLNAPELGVVTPIGPGAANVAPPRVDASIAELQPNPVPEVHLSAFPAELHDGTETAAGIAGEPELLARMLLALIAARTPVGMMNWCVTVSSFHPETHCAPSQNFTVGGLADVSAQHWNGINVPGAVGPE